MKIGFIGYGEMGQAIAKALACEAVVSTAHKPNTVEVAKKCRTIFLCVRPAQAEAVAKELKPLLTKQHTLVSIMAGKRLTTLKKLFGTKATIIRAMPNLGVKVGCGMVAVTDGKVSNLLAPVGMVAVLPERLFDAFTAVAGSGPAWTAYFLQSQIEAAKKLGIKANDAIKFAAVTILGTLRYLFENEVNIPDFIRQVATPGGTTAAGMAKLADGRFLAAITETLVACAARSKELGK